MQTLSERSNEKLYRNGEFFNMLSAPALADFEKLLVPISHPANHILFSETQSSTGIFVVIEGEVKLSMNSSDGRRLSLTIVKAGEIRSIQPGSRTFPVRHSFIFLPVIPKHTNR